MRAKLTPLLENIAESTTACLVTMVQGNLLALTMTHWIVASRTGVVAGIVASTAILLARSSRPWVISTALGAATAVVDYFVHPGALGGVAVEAVVTGLGAALLSYLVGAAVRRVAVFRAAVPK